MARIRVTCEEIVHRHDCERIQSALRAEGFHASLLECQVMWKAFSDSLAPVWLILDDDDADIVNNIRSYFEAE